MRIGGVSIIVIISQWSEGWNSNEVVELVSDRLCLVDGVYFLHRRCEVLARSSPADE